MDPSPIAKLVPELLQKVFELIAQDPNASITNSILVCKKWRPIAQSILYTDVALSPERLVKFLDNSADEQIHSLTILMDTILNNPYEPSEAAQTAKTRLDSLDRLLPRMKKMSSTLFSFSITVHFPGPLLPTHEISSLLEILPESCTSLEVDVRQTGFVMNQSPNHPTTHLCDSIRSILSQLVHLRLRLPAICPALFGVESHGENASYQAISAPQLQSCIINLAGREPGPTSSDAMATRCRDNYSQTSQVGSMTRFPSSLPPLVPSLKDFARLNSNLQRFWVIDVQPRDPTQPHQWAAFVRRDVLTDASFPVPLANIGSFFSDEWLARVPKEQSRVEDWLVPLALLERVAEDGAWSETATGVRLATPTLRGSEIVPKGRIRPQSEEENGGTHILWRNEKTAGKRMLPEGPGPFMQNWDMNERTPGGWTRENHMGSSIVRV